MRREEAPAGGSSAGQARIVQTMPREGCVVRRGPAVVDEPWIALILEEFWTCALLRAELLERGRSAACVGRLGVLLVASRPAPMNAPMVIVADESALSGRDRGALRWMRAVGAPMRTVVIAHATVDVEGPWDRVVRRPISLGDVATIVNGMAHELRSTPRPVRETEQIGPRASSTGTLSAFEPIAGLELRMGPPWPMIRCPSCNASRHCKTPGTPGEIREVQEALVNFALVHDHPGA
jgi:hypothetical protein